MTDHLAACTCDDPDSANVAALVTTGVPQFTASLHVYAGVALEVGA